ncbi:VrrA/YqfQ family protein [Neobacillus sp. SCS-31]|uniref:VrrA/YqfQ family protein n=1 Tax=Neobacillus oceani TaxID=3115292 RepID=UPI00390689F5
MMPPIPYMRRQGGFGRMPMGGPPFGRQPGFPGSQRPPIMGPMNPMQRQPSRGGGLLARLFGRSGSGPTQAAAGRGGTAAGEAGASSVLKTLGNPDAINTFLANTQNVLNTAQQFGPLIEQYGPLFKNLPAMWKLYRGLKDADGDKATPSDKASVKETQGTSPAKAAASNKPQESRKKYNPVHSTGKPAGETKSEPPRGKSRPKLFF